MTEKETLSASQEDYLEAIFHIVEDKQAARAKDIAERMGVTGASVTGALHALARKELVHHEPYDIVTLTDRGQAAARSIVRRHTAWKDFFVQVLGIEDDLAEECACRMEHAMPQEILKRLVEFVDYVEDDLGGNVEWDEANGRFRTKKTVGDQSE